MLIDFCLAVYLLSLTSEFSPFSYIFVVMLLITEQFLVASLYVDYLQLKSEFHTYLTFYPTFHPCRLG